MEASVPINTSSLLRVGIFGNTLEHLGKSSSHTEPKQTVKTH